MPCLVRFCFVLLACVVCFLNLLHFSQSHAEIPLLLLISFDGFRWDYLDLMKKAGYTTPNFDRLIFNGVTTEKGGLKNAFLTKTFPNHFTLVTGLYEENHGVVANSFFDPDFNETFHMNLPSSEYQKWWDGKSGKGAEPIWVANDRPGGRRVSGAYFWPGTNVDNQRPFYTRCYSKNVPMTDGVDTIVNWFTDKSRPINLGLLYYGEPDHTGHQTGAGSEKVLEKIRELDGILGRLIDSLEDRNLFDRINIILTSDHGMTNITEFIYLSDYVNTTLFTYYGGSPVWNIRPNPGKDTQVYEALKKVPNLRVYKKAEVPEDFHYSNNRRIQAIVVAAAEGFNICLEGNGTDCDPQQKGNHGYNNSLQSMHPIFIAHGPAFKKNVTSAPFNNVDVYPLMCHILHISPHPNDGRLDNVVHLLAEDDDDDEEGSISITMVTFLMVVGLSALVSGVCCIAACRSHRIYLRKRGNAQFLRGARPVANSLDMRDANKQPLLVSEEEDFA